MQVAMAAPHIALPAALLQQPWRSEECRLRRLRLRSSISSAGKQAAARKAAVLSVDECRDRFDPGLGRRARGRGMRGRDRIRDGVDETGIERARLQPDDRWSGARRSGSFQRHIRPACHLPSMLKDPSSLSRDRDDATIDLRRELPVDPDLFVAGGFPLLQRRIIEEGKADGALDLQRAARLRERPMPRGCRCDGR